MIKWIEVTKSEFFATGIIVSNALIYSSYTNCVQDYAETVFSTNCSTPTHKTVHNKGVSQEPSYYVRSDG